MHTSLCKLEVLDCLTHVCEAVKNVEPPVYIVKCVRISFLRYLYQIPDKHMLGLLVSHKVEIKPANGVSRTTEVSRPHNKNTQ